jgi:hypothetical protein
VPFIRFIAGINCINTSLKGEKGIGLLDCTSGENLCFLPFTGTINFLLLSYGEVALQRG